MFFAPPAEDSSCIFFSVDVSLSARQLSVAPQLATLSDAWVAHVRKNNQIESACHLMQRDIAAIREAMEAKLASSSSSASAATTTSAVPSASPASS
jgi:hypothetical protein